jgi:hypothetical protein
MSPFSNKSEERIEMEIQKEFLQYEITPTLTLLSLRSSPCTRIVGRCYTASGSYNDGIVTF